VIQRSWCAFSMKNFDHVFALVPFILFHQAVYLSFLFWSRFFYPFFLVIPERVAPWSRMHLIVLALPQLFFSLLFFPFRFLPCAPESSIFPRTQSLFFLRADRFDHFSTMYYRNSVSSVITTYMSEQRLTRDYFSLKTCFLASFE
jgi:hypothetical protein